MRFTLRQLEYFIAAAESGSITAASDRIHISQPSISTAISGLEKELDVQLFVRHHAQGLSLTHSGQVLLRKSKELIADAQSFYGLAAETTMQIRGEISLGCLVTLAPMVLPEIVHSFITTFPKTSIQQQVGDQEELLSSLRRAETDIAIIYNLQIPKDVAFVALADLPPHVLVGKSHALARRTAVTLDELTSLPMILLDLPLSRDYFLSLFIEKHLVPNIAYRLQHPEVIRTMVANCYGYSLVNVRSRSSTALDGRELKSLFLVGHHRPMQVGLATLKSLRKSKLVDTFESHCRSFVSNNYVPGMNMTNFSMHADVL